MSVTQLPITIDGYRAILYTRDSDEIMLAQYAPDDLLFDMAEDEGFEVVGVARDVKVHSLSPPMERPAFSQVIQALEDDQADAVVVPRLDRLGRNFPIQDDAVQRIWKAGGRLISVDYDEWSEWTPDRHGDRQWSQRKELAQRAEAELLALKSRLQEGRRRHMANGGYGGGNHRRPYGRKLVHRRGKRVYVLVLEEQEVIRMICDWMRIDPAPEGVPQKCVPMKHAWAAEHLNDMGIPTVEGGPWGRKFVGDLARRGPDRLRLATLPDTSQPLVWIKQPNAAAG